jgi:hypothetical protein
VVAELHNAIQQHEWVEQRVLASRASAGVGTVCRVLRRLREAGLVVSDGGEFVPSMRRATCQRHRFVPSEAIVAVTSEDRLLRTDAYVWLTETCKVDPENAKKIVRRKDYIGICWRRWEAGSGALTPIARNPPDRVAELRAMPYGEYLCTQEWKSTREIALQRAGHRCQLCKKGGPLSVHHNTYERLGEEMPSDLIALCKSCHGHHHHRLKSVA